MNFQQANDLLTGRCQQSRKLGNNTYLKRRGNNIAVMLHATDVITFKPDNTAVLDSGGWRTVTTKARMNKYLFDDTRQTNYLYQDKGIWQLADQKQYCGY